jgi:SAM-dependent methyltransferase
MRRTLKRILLGLGLYGVFWKARGWLRGFSPKTLYRNWRWRRSFRDPVPLPPSRLMFEVVHSYSVEGFLRGGSERAEAIAEAVANAGLDMANCGRILDFGCGCGRVIRHLPQRTDAELFGSDLNPRLVRWCSENLSFGTFAVNDLAPPLSYDDAFFDLVYSISVLTHLDEDLQNRWLAELTRVITPGGFLLVTTHGDSCFDGLDADEAARYRAGKLVVRSSHDLGSNLCETYHPPVYFKAVAESLFAQVHHVPQGGPGQRAQDIWVLRTPATS